MITIGTVSMCALLTRNAEFLDKFMTHLSTNFSCLVSISYSTLPWYPKLNITLFSRHVFAQPTNKKEGKVVPVLNELSISPWRRMGGGCIDPRFLDLYTSSRWVVSFTPWSPVSNTWRRKNYWPYQDSNSGSSVVRLVASHFSKIYCRQNSQDP
jgi:hypothetical protein